MASGELTTRFTIGDRAVHRLGYGTMQLTGLGVWGPPADPAGAVAVLRRAAELGVDLFDTADSYGPYVAEELLREALHPYDGLTIATKAGLLRTGPRVWVPCGRPEYLRQECEMSLRRLGVERIDLFQLHRVDPTVPTLPSSCRVARRPNCSSAGTVGSMRCSWKRSIRSTPRRRSDISHSCRRYSGRPQGTHCAGPVRRKPALVAIVRPS